MVITSFQLMLHNMHFQNCGSVQNNKQMIFKGKIASPSAVSHHPVLALVVEG